MLSGGIAGRHYYEFVRRTVFSLAAVAAKIIPVGAPTEIIISHAGTKTQRKNIKSISLYLREKNILIQNAGIAYSFLGFVSAVQDIPPSDHRRVSKNDHSVSTHLYFQVRHVSFSFCGLPFFLQ
jgi:hypothetical protein